MAFKDISRRSQDVLQQNYRVGLVLPGAVPPGRGDAASASDASLAVCDDFIQVVPFVRADEDGRAFGSHVQVRSARPVREPEYTSRGSATAAWSPGRTMPFGEELDRDGTRFKRISTVVRTSELMNAGGLDDMLEVQADLARIAVVRALSEAVFHSDPPTDDDGALAGLPYAVGVSSPQTVTYDPARGLIGGLSEIEARCHPSDGDFGAGADVFVMSSRARWRLLKELEDRGVTPDFAFYPALERRVLHFHGIPVLGGRVPEPAGDPPVTEAWALRLDGPSGVRILHLDGDSSEYGLREQPVTMVAGLDTQGEAENATAGLEVFGVYSLHVPEVRSAARLRTVPAGDPYTQP